MYTCCPECRTWFRVTETQLGVARAWLRCGQCLASFDASSRLWSRPDEGSPMVTWRTADQGRGDAAALAAAEPQAQAAASRPSSEDVQENDQTEPFDPLLSPPRPDNPFGEDGIFSSVDFGRGDIEVDLEPEPPGPAVGDVRQVSSGEAHVRPGDSDRIHEGRIPGRHRRSREQAILSRIEGLDVRRRRRWAANSCIVLLLLLTLQYTWFMAGDLAAAFPVLGPALDEFCMATGCETKRRSGGGLRVVSRTVRPHAEYMSALSVRATLENRSPDVRPFPVVVFVLYGKDGRTVGSRTFEPAEYLGAGALPGDGLESGRRVDIAFDLVAPSEVAVSFDLRLI